MTPDSRLPHVYLIDALKFLKEHSWVSGAVATLLLLAHFARIGYLPALSLADLGLVGTAILSFTAVTAVLFLTVYLLPAACYESWGAARLIPRQELPGRGSRYRRLYAPQREALQPDSLDAPADSKRSRNGTFALVLAISYAGFFLAVATLALTMLAPEGIRDGLFITFFGISFLLSAVLAALSSGKFTRRIRESKVGWRWRLLLLTWLLYSAAIPFALIMLSVLPSADVFKVELRGIIPLLALPLAHFCIYSTSRLPNPVRANALLFVGIYIVVSLGIAFAAMDAAASQLRVGMLKNQTVILTARGCSSLKVADIVKECTEVPGDTILRSAGPVDILTRVGSHVVISQPGWEFKGGAISAPIKAAEVDTWFPAARPSAGTVKTRQSHGGPDSP